MSCYHASGSVSAYIESDKVDSVSGGLRWAVRRVMTEGPLPRGSADDSEGIEDPVELDSSLIRTDEVQGGNK